MENIYDKVEKLLQEEPQRPAWVDEMLFELRTIRRLLERTHKREGTHKEERGAYYAFVNKLRKQLRADIVAGKYPEIHYRGRVLGVNLKGFIYDKKSTNDLPAHEAFEVYRFLYENRQNLEKYLVL